MELRVRLIKLVALAAFVAAGSGLPLLTRGRAQQPQMAAPASQPTTWRTSKPFAQAGYVGAAACAKCHVEESASQHETAMGRALETGAESVVLRSRPKMSFRSGPYLFEITRRGGESIYSVTDGKQTFSVPILYAFGQGKAGQTYVYKIDDVFYESRLSYYKEIDGLDFTMGYDRTVPPTLAEALGRRQGRDEIRGCFACHGTAGTAGSKLQLEHLTVGVRCEACHGPGRDHVAAMEAGRVKEKHIFNPGRMSADDLSQEFCGSCHRSAEEVIMNKNLHGVQSVRFQPYRLFTSSGHDPSDARLSCTACHDPHRNPREDAAYYDAKCNACHQSAAAPKSPAIAKTEAAAGRTAKPCPVSQKSCSTCHMPKVELPGSHFKFTDHRIRIARPGEPVPN
jgi:hypothetical protein